MFKRFWSKAPLAIFIASVLLATFVYGIATVRLQIFPYSIVNRAELAWKALKEVYWPNQDAKGQDPLAPPANKAPLANPVTLDLRPESADELFLINGGLRMEGKEKFHYLARLVDRTGKLRHTWPYDPQIWEDLSIVKTVPGKSQVDAISHHLEPNGDLIVSFHGVDTWPYAVGMAKFDRNGKLLWKKELLTHHWFSVGDDGRIHVPGLRIVDSPVHLGQTFGAIYSDKGQILDDTVLVLDPNGNVLEEVSILKSLGDSELAGLAIDFKERPKATPPGVNIEMSAWDPVHLNDVRLVSAADARLDPILKEGDWLVSLRSMNVIGIIDRDTKLFKWIAAGRTLRQHSPRFWNGGVLAFDNWGGDRKTGGSRLVRIDFNQGVLPETVFPRPSHPTSEPFLSQLSGHIDRHPDGKRALIASSYQGLIWEVDLSTGEVLWEYIGIAPWNPLKRTRLTCAKYCRELNFTFNQDGLTEGVH
ncbi:MAG: arylsulfotransferase family protein [Planctomycetales bacterium]